MSAERDYKASLAIAFSWANGQIEIGRRTKPGTLPIHAGDATKLRLAVNALAERGNDGLAYVPGMRGAKTFNDRCFAIAEFEDRVRKAIEEQS